MQGHSHQKNYQPSLPQSQAIRRHEDHPLGRLPGIRLRRPTSPWTALTYLAFRTPQGPYRPHTHHRNTRPHQDEHHKMLE